MPYHIFEINPFRQFTYLQSMEKYREAKQFLRDRRTAQDAPSGITYRMMFAATPEQAERLLNEKREPRPMGEHD